MIKINEWDVTVRDIGVEIMAKTVFKTIYNCFES